MQVNVLLFGQLTEIAGKSSITLAEVVDTDTVKAKLHHTYPALNNSNYLIAVDKKVIATNTLLTDNCTVALLPPYSGG